MKKKFFEKNLWALFFSAVAFSSCSEQEILQNDSKQVEITATLNYDFIEESDFGTRTSMKESSAGAPQGTLWILGDQIGCYTSYEQNVPFTNITQTASSTVNFSGYTINELPQFAYYPYTQENDEIPITALKGEIPLVQRYSTTDKELKCDWKVGVRKANYRSQFDFKNLFSLICLRVNASDTPLEGDSLISIAFSSPDNKQLGGKFTFDMSGSNPLNTAASSVKFVDNPQNSNTLLLEFSDKPVLKDGSTYNGYLTVAPVFESGDKMIITITTTKYVARFERTCSNSLKANGCYSYSLKLATYATQDSWQIKENISVPAVEPVLKAIKFEVAKNEGKILPGYVQATTYSAEYKSGIKEQVCSIDEDGKTVSLYLPYLNNRKLVPTFEIPEGTTLMTESGEPIISGETMVDFSVNKKIKVVNSANEEAVYEMNLTNTGLPVVVVNQATGLVTSSSDDTKLGSAAWYKATKTGWQPKDSDWLMSDETVDNFMVYYADGTPALTDKNGAPVDEPVLSSTRVRGNVSQQMPKKPFAVKLNKKHGVFLNDNDPTNDMEAHKRWVLLAGWNDRTMMRNAIAFDIAHLFENNLSGGIAWNSSVQHVELVYNGVHVGNYLLGEQIKIDENRLNIKPAYDKDDAFSGNVADYGYLLESDDGYDENTKFITKNYIPFLFKDDADEGGQMLAHVKGIVEKIEENLYNGKYSEAYKTLDMNSMVDFLLIHEVMMNGELKHPKSVHSYIVDGVMYAGPVWDFDWQTIPNISVINSYYDNAYTGGRDSYKYNNYTTSMLTYATLKRKSSTPLQSELAGVENYMWFPMLVKDATFKAAAKERWATMSSILIGYANTQISVMADKIRKSQEENWKMWPINPETNNGSTGGKNRYETYNIGGGFCGDERAASFDAAVDLLKSNLINRINGMSYVTNQSWPNISSKSSSGFSSWWSR